MALHLHIERLVLDGLPMGPRERRELEAALGAELGRLLAGGALHPELAAGGAVPALRAPDLALAPGASGAAIGHGLAASIHAGLAPGREVSCARQGRTMKNVAHSLHPAPTDAGPGFCPPDRERSTKNDPLRGVDDDQGWEGGLQGAQQHDRAHHLRRLRQVKEGRR